MSVPNVIFVDTSVFGEQRYNFQSAAMTAFLEVTKTAPPTLLFPAPTEQEIARHIQEQVDAVSKLRTRSSSGSEEFSIAGLDRSDDDEDGVQDPKDPQENEADQNQAKDRGDNVVDEHRDLEIERFFAVRIAAGPRFGFKKSEKSRAVLGCICRAFR
jgi:hypothetical protein